MKINIELKDTEKIMQENSITIAVRDNKIKVSGNSLNGDIVLQMLEAMAFATTFVASGEYEDNIRGITLMKRDVMEYCRRGMENALDKLGE